MSGKQRDTVGESPTDTMQSPVNNAFHTRRHVRYKSSQQYTVFNGSKSYAASSSSSYWGLSAFNDSQPKVITVLRGGSKPRPNVKILLNRRSVQSYEQLVKDISDAFGPKFTSNRVRKLFAIDGREVQGLADLFRDEHIYIGVGSEELIHDEVQDILNELFPDSLYAGTLMKKWDRAKRRRDRKSFRVRDIVESDKTTKETEDRKVKEDVASGTIAKEDVPEESIKHDDKNSFGFEADKNAGQIAFKKSQEGKVHAEEINAKEQEPSTDQLGNQEKNLNNDEAMSIVSSNRTPKPISHLRPSKPRSYRKTSISHADEITVTSERERLRLIEEEKERERIQQQVMRKTENERRIPYSDRRRRAPVHLKPLRVVEVLEEPNQPETLVDHPKHDHSKEDAEVHNHSSPRRTGEPFSPRKVLELTSPRKEVELSSPKKIIEPSSRRKVVEPSPVVWQRNDELETPYVEETFPTNVEEQKQPDGAFSERTEKKQLNDINYEATDEQTVQRSNSLEVNNNLENQNAIKDTTRQKEQMSVVNEVVLAQNNPADNNDVTNKASNQHKPEPDVSESTISEKDQMKKRTGPVVYKSKLERQVSNSGHILNLYEIGSILGDGNFAVVKRSKKKSNGKEYAMKVIDKSKLRGKENMIENEIAIMKACSHSNIVRLYEEYETRNEIYLIMELVKVSVMISKISTLCNFKIVM